MAINNTVEDINNQPTIKPEIVTGAFLRYMAKTIPLAFDESMSYYEAICALRDYINQFIDNLNNVNEGLGELQEFYLELQTYVNNYFDNLDVQEEINNKLDKMAEDGSLGTIIGVYVNPLINAQNQVIDNFINESNTTIATIKAQVDAVGNGAPLVASSTAGMTNTAKVYVNTTDGKWYYYDGDSWEIGGTYQTAGIGEGSVTLNSLGNDVVYDLKTRINDKDEYVYYNEKIIDLSKVNLVNKDTNASGEITQDRTSRATSTYLIYMPVNTKIVINTNPNNYMVSVYCFDEDGTYIALRQLSSSILQNAGYPKNTKYVRLKFNKSDSSQDITSTEVINNISLKIVPEFKENKNTVAEGNLINDYKSYTGFLNSASRPYDISTSSSYKTSEFIHLKAATSYTISRFRKFALYDTNYEYIADSFIDTDTANHTFTTTNECYLVISYSTSQSGNVYVVEGSSGSYSAYIEKLPPYVQLQNVANLSEILNTANVLYNKKWVALGDSFTAGAFGDDPADTDYIDSGIYEGQFKVYPYLIGNRNIMNITNLAVGGMTITNINGESNNYLSDSVLANIPSDVDYITIKIGINDAPDHQNAPLGTIDSTDSTTFYGSWNRVMTYLINNYKNAKIGIIVTNGMNDINMVNAEIAIANKYGVAFINETTDNNIPLLIRTLRSDVSSAIKTIRNNEWYVSEDNHHPNAKCHEYESTIIEDFLRRL